MFKSLHTYLAVDDETVVTVVDGTAVVAVVVTGTAVVVDTRAAADDAGSDVFVNTAVSVVA